VCGRGCYSFNIRDLFSSRIHKDGEIVGLVWLASHYLLLGQEIYISKALKSAVDNLLLLDRLTLRLPQAPAGRELRFAVIVT
jgi:hypothetical protein